MEIYYEQNVVNTNIDERTKKTKVLIVAKPICTALAVFILISSAMLGEFFFNYFWIFILLSLPLFGASLILGKINKRNNTEYDYVIDDEFINISEIYFRERRKLKYSIRLRFIESVGVFDSEGYKKIERNAQKKILALVNYDDEQAIVYILYKSKKGRNIMFIEPDRGFMIALRRALSAAAVTVFDKSITALEKLLTEKESEATRAEDDEEDDGYSENTNDDNDDSDNEPDDDDSSDGDGNEGKMPDNIDELGDAAWL